MTSHYRGGIAMAQKTVQGNATLARKIRSRRNELGLTLEEAASRAGVGTKTWCRYEAGESIRMDKCKGICKALNWITLPDQDLETHDILTAQEYKNHEAWSQFLENTYGENAAMSFATGSDIVLDHINEDLAELASMPVGTHLGQLSVSWLRSDLPEQFLMHYNYNFLYQMKCTLQVMRQRAKHDQPMTAHSVMEELLLYLCNEEASVLIELCNGSDEEDIPDEWVFDLLGDMDIVTCLYADRYLETDNSYHFLHWNDQQSCIEQSERMEV
jgi:transcriptional regulator with XRE-family HTH domain